MEYNQFYWPDRSIIRTRVSGVGVCSNNEAKTTASSVSR